MQIWIGTSGYSYPDWVGGFYPRGTRPNRMLDHYCGHFPLVELNFTFYRLPTPSMLARLADQTPAGFQFLVKMPRSLSHEESNAELAGFRAAVEELQRRDRLLGLLCQLPQACHHTRRHLAWLDTLGKDLQSFRLAVEFRHRSWFRPEVPGWLRERGMDLVAVDVPDLPNLYPRGPVQSSPTIYVRFHSRNGSNWYGSDKDRYNYWFDDAALTEWIDALTRVREETKRVFLLFNNCHRSQAAENAGRMAELIRRLAPTMEVVPPFAELPTMPRQPSLFDDT